MLRGGGCSPGARLSPSRSSGEPSLQGWSGCRARAGTCAPHQPGATARSSGLTGLHRTARLQRRHGILRLLVLRAAAL